MGDTMRNLEVRILLALNPEASSAATTPLCSIRATADSWDAPRKEPRSPGEPHPTAGQERVLKSSEGIRNGQNSEKKITMMLPVVGSDLTNYEGFFP